MTASVREYTTFSPGLATGDALVNYWIRHATLRLRREVCWAWRERTGSSGTGTAPPLTERVSESLDRVRYWEDKQRFFATDPTAQYLTTLIETDLPRSGVVPERGTLAWLEQEAGLRRVDLFALTLALLAAFDSAAEPVFAACNNDATRTYPTLALVQRLWDDQADALTLADPAHPLFAYGLLRKVETAGTSDWDTALQVPELVARRFLCGAASEARSLRRVAVTPDAAPPLPEPVRLSALRFRGRPRDMRIVPLRMPAGAPASEVAARLGEAMNRTIVELSETAHVSSISAAITLCWLNDTDLLLDPAFVPDKARLTDTLLQLCAVPVNVFMVTESALPDGLPQRLLTSPVDVPPLTYSQRLEAWKRSLGSSAAVLAPAVAEVSRRFRYEAAAIERIGEGLRSAPSEISLDTLTAACRAASRIELGDMAQRVMPRFDRATDLVLPARQRGQFQEVLRAMRALTEVHYRWGTARVWNEAGVSVLFAGPPGTGKTMAAEVLASELDLPMYRIDLSQVVNKYIGETEKNLKRIFDAADTSDVLLFFDEADAIFGKRMEARDAHDRYANLEISYLLDRMERFKGLAVLATNRKKDLDEAFLRRLRYIIEFPLPGRKERLQIWQRSLPPDADSDGLDLAFLSDAFPLSGGHIRSIVFNACLQSAGRSGRPRLRIEDVLVAVKRELDKMGRPIGLEAFGAHAPLIRNLDDEDEDD
jgi:hypothetical protein